MTKLPILLIASLSTALAFAAAAVADGPVIQTLPLNATNVPWGPTCGAEPIIASFSGTVRIESFYDGSTLVLWFRYGFHHKKAQEQSAQLMPLVRAWLGDGVKIDFRLREAGGASGPGPKTPSSPEDDPFVREVVRRFDGRVTRVKEVSE